MIDPFEALVSFLCPLEGLYPLIFASDLLATASVVGNWSYQATEVPDEPQRDPHKQARISTSPSFVLCEHYGSFHSKICGRLDLGLNLKVNGDMNCSGTLGMDPVRTKSSLSMKSM